jgi:DNA-binding CsgD family transcriptional regulator
MTGSGIHETGQEWRGLGAFAKICLMLGISKPTLYAHVRSAEELENAG